MGQQGDLVDDLGCSDQRLIFKLVVAELRRARKAMFSAKVILAAGEDDCRTRALEILDAKEPA